MSNFIQTFNEGRKGVNKGLPFGPGLEKLTKDVNGIQKRRIYGVAGPEKSGKSTFADAVFLFHAYKYCVDNKISATWIYYSFEIDRISKEFEAAVYFMYEDYGIEDVQLDEGVLKDGSNIIPLSADYLRGLVMDDSDKMIVVNDKVFEKLQEVYENRIIPIFGEYDEKGNQLEPGVVQFIKKPENPTGIYKTLLAFAEDRGTIHHAPNFEGKEVIDGYTANNPEEYVFVIIDHLRKLRNERGFKVKETIDKMTEYLVELRDLLGYTFVPILHTNRNLSAVDRLNRKGDLYPTSDDLKDSGNLGEDCNYLYTMFNPNDDKYGLKNHFGVEVRDSKGNLNFPEFKSIHLASCRHRTFPRHYSVNMRGNLKHFENLK